MEKNESGWFFDELTQGMKDRYAHHADIHKNDPPSYAEQQIIINVIGVVPTCVEMGLLSPEQAAIVIKKFNELSHLQVTYESLVSYFNKTDEHDQRDRT